MQTGLPVSFFTRLIQTNIKRRLVRFIEKDLPEPVVFLWIDPLSLQFNLWMRHNPTGVYESIPLVRVIHHRHKGVVYIGDRKVEAQMESH